MDKQQNKKTPSRRGFLSMLIKMLTADGRLVEVEKSVYEQASKGKKAGNKEIMEWMNNPSKENNSRII
jgi:hypothetical protein